MQEEPAFLELLKDPARREKARQDQEERRAKNSHVLNRTPAEANFLFGIAKERQVLGQLEGLDPESGNKQFDFLREQLAEGYALQARFDEAATSSVEPEKIDSYQKRAKAIEKVGELTCSCPATIVTPSKVDAKGNRSPARWPIETVSDGERTFTISRCRTCGAINAT